MNLILNFVILIFLIITLIKIGMKPHIYKRISENEMYKYIYILLYRGLVYSNIFQNGALFIKAEQNDWVIFLTKYKEKGNIGLYLHLPVYKDIPDCENKSIRIIKKMKCVYYYDEPCRSNANKILAIDVKQNITLTIELIKEFFREIFKFNCFNLYKIHFCNVSNVPDRIIGFSETPDFEKLGIDITLPVSNAVWVVRQTKIFIARLLSRI